MKGQIQFSISWRRAGVPKVVKSIIWQELYYISKTPPFSTKETEMCRDGLLTFSVRFREEREKYLSSSSAPSSSPNRYLPDPPLSVWNLIIDLIMPNTCPHKMISTIWEKCWTCRHLLTLQVGLLETKKTEILWWHPMNIIFSTHGRWPISHYSRWMTFLIFKQLLTGYF